MNKKILFITSLLFCTFFLSCTEDEEYTYGVWERRSDFDGLARHSASSFMIDGNGFICCGYESKSSLHDLWEYNVQGDYWTQRASLPESAKRNTAVGFSINGKGYITTGSEGTSYLQDTWEYDPVTDTWTQKDDYPKARHSALAFSIGNYGYVGTGYDGNYQKDFYKFEPSATAGSQWTIVNGYGGQKRQGGTAFVIDDKAYVCCGVNNGSYVTDLWSYDPSTDTWEKKRDIANTSSEDYDDDYIIVRTYTANFVIDNKAYLVTGEYGSLLSTYWIYNPETDLWTGEDLTPFEGTSRYKAVAFSTGTRGFVTTGMSSSYVFDDLWELLPYEIEEDD